MCACVCVTFTLDGDKTFLGQHAESIFTCDYAWLGSDIPEDSASFPCTPVPKGCKSNGRLAPGPLHGCAPSRTSFPGCLQDPAPHSDRRANAPSLARVDGVPSFPPRHPASVSFSPASPSTARLFAYSLSPAQECSFQSGQVLIPQALDLRPGTLSRSVNIYGLKSSDVLSTSYWSSKAPLETTRDFDFPDLAVLGGRSAQVA